jgi:hypothetical protein
MAMDHRLQPGRRRVLLLGLLLVLSVASPHA